MTILPTVPDVRETSDDIEVLPQLLSGVSFLVSCTPISLNASIQSTLENIGSSPLGCRDFLVRMPIAFSATSGCIFGAPREQRLVNFSSWVVLPEIDASTEAAESISDQLHEIIHMTEWSHRDLARVLQTSHTTVRKLLMGGSVSARSMPIASRIRPVHDIVSRLYVVARRDSAKLAIAFASSRDDGTTAVDLLARGEDNAAYAAVIKALRSRREDSESRPRRLRPADATVELS